MGRGRVGRGGIGRSRWGGMEQSDGGWDGMAAERITPNIDAI